MKEKIFCIESVAQFNRMKGVETLHPLVSVMDLSETLDAPIPEKSFSYGFYCVYIKEIDCGNIIYGRRTYDYEEGTIVCIAPGQVMSVVKHDKSFKPKGWALLFHPDLLRGTSLGRNMKNYTFFSYQVNEALHLSLQEKQTVVEILKIIRTELQHPVDGHTKQLITNNIELFLNYCSRFYERQFTTRLDVSNDIVSKFQSLLDDYYKEGLQYKEGIPSVKYCAGKLCFSPNYFGDLMKKETGKNAQETIQSYIMDRAKELILGSDKTISEISYSLGFQYPTHFSRQFKKLENCTPAEYRIAN